jgi:hypothetical protein
MKRISPKKRINGNGFLVIFLLGLLTGYEARAQNRIRILSPIEIEISHETEMAEGRLAPEPELEVEWEGAVLSDRKKNLRALSHAFEFEWNPTKMKYEWDEIRGEMIHYQGFLPFHLRLGSGQYNAIADLSYLSLGALGFALERKLGLDRFPPIEVEMVVDWQILNRILTQKPPEGLNQKYWSQNRRMQFSNSYAFEGGISVALLKGAVNPGIAFERGLVRRRGHQVREGTGPLRGVQSEWELGVELDGSRFFSREFLRRLDVELFFLNEKESWELGAPGSLDHRALQNESTRAIRVGLVYSLRP